MIWICSFYTQQKKLLAIYEYVISSVIYDQRYYNVSKTMLYVATTAYGALHDNLAICGGFSWAVNVPAEKTCVECYYVSGSSYSEYHMWNIAKYNGEFHYFDAAFDKGRNGNFRYFAKKADEFVEDHTWNETFVDSLIGS